MVKMKSEQRIAIWLLECAILAISIFPVYEYYPKSVLLSPVLALIPFQVAGIVEFVRKRRCTYNMWVVISVVTSLACFFTSVLVYVYGAASC